MPSKQEKSGPVETGLTEPVATPCNAIMTSSRCRNLHYVFLILTAVDCGNLTHPANGSVNHTAGTFGQTATYICNTGYNLVGDSIRTCQATGNWSGSVPTCEGMLLEGDDTLFMCVCTQKHANVYYLCLVWVQECMMILFLLWRSREE